MLKVDLLLRKLILIVGIVLSFLRNNGLHTASGCKKGLTRLIMSQPGSYHSSLHTHTRTHTRTERVSL
uniref:Putative secreted protein n=1 Tax=Anopheles darlingi TaxID=43151 RepID=A0A2M4DF29_ANODA